MNIYKKIFHGLMIVLGILTLLIALFFFNQDFQEFVLSSIAGEETIYAKGYSYKAWKKVKIDDTVDRVLLLLGEPLKVFKSDDGSFSYYYTYKGPKDTNYKMKAIIFNNKGRVIEKVREFYMD